MLRIDIQRHSRTATLHCRGRIVFGMELETLRSIAMSQAERTIVIDLAGIETVDASGLGLLVELQHWAVTGGRTIRFTNASEFVSRLVLLTRLYHVLAIAPAPGNTSCEPAAVVLTA